MEDSKLNLTRLKKKHKPGYRWPVEKRIEVVTTYLATGNMRLVADLTGVSYGLIRLWKLEDWWKEFELEIKASRAAGIVSKLDKIVQKSLEITQDRLENGDFHYDKASGDIIRIPVNMRDSNRVTVDLLRSSSELQRQQRDAESQVKQEQTMQDQLNLLKDQFAAFTRRNKTDAIDIDSKEITDAIHEEREEGLLEGTSVGAPDSPEPSEGEGSEEFSEIDDGEEGISEERGWEGRGPQDAPIEGRKSSSF